MRITAFFALAFAIVCPAFLSPSDAFADPGVKHCETGPTDLDCKAAPDPLQGLKWGVALVYSDQKGGVGDVVKGSDNVVRVKSQNRAAARGAFELHYFIKVDSKPVAFGWGPFVSLNTKPVDNLNSGSFFSSVGVGLMIGVDALNGSEGDSINFGLGYLIDTDVRELAPGVEAGKTTSLVGDELTTSTTKSGFMAILSYKLNFN